VFGEPPVGDGVRLIKHLRERRMLHVVPLHVV
jgi:hypothetical protein